MKSFAVIGLGRFGTRIAESLYALGEDVIAIDTNEESVNKIADSVSQAVCADAKDKDVLKKLGVDKCDTAVVALGSNLAASVLITMNLASLGLKSIICKAHDITHKEILEKLGATRVIIPESEVAEKTARSLSSPDFLELMELSEEHGIIEITPPASWIGNTIIGLRIRDKYHVNIIGIKENEKLTVNFPADLALTGKMKLVILGEYTMLDKLPQ